MDEPFRTSTPAGRCLNESLLHAPSSTALNTIIANEFRYNIFYLPFNFTVTYKIFLFVTLHVSTTEPNWMMFGMAIV